MARSLVCQRLSAHKERVTDARTSPDATIIEGLARAAVDRLPDLFRQHLRNVMVRVEEFADDETLDALGIEDPWELSGLYHGRPMSEQTIWASGELPPVITLYRRPLLDEWIETGATLDDLVTHVLVHEVGHHFGLSDEQMAAIEAEL